MFGPSGCANWLKCKNCGPIKPSKNGLTPGINSKNMHSFSSNAVNLHLCRIEAIQESMGIFWNCYHREKNAKCLFNDFLVPPPQHVEYLSLGAFRLSYGAPLGVQACRAFNRCSTRTTLLDVVDQCSLKPLLGGHCKPETARQSLLL